ncbi:hypothetical protein CF335_g5826 [Tilletia laevis]|nr:hypothetical protein CF335_g5826 [Tilletia laevis]
MAHLPELVARYRASLAALDLALSLPFYSRLSASELRLSSWLASSSVSPRSTPMPTLIHEGRSHSDPASKLEAIHSFFSPFTDRTPSLSLSNPTAPPPFTAEDVAQALKLANRRASAGPDGLMYRVWFELLPTSGPLLAALANSLGEGQTFPVAARSILLPKKARLLAVGDDILPWTQAAFLPGRRTTLVSGILQCLMDLGNCGSSLSPPPFFVISLDQKKAYDRVRHEWLFACLRNLGLPLPLLLLLAALYSEATTRFHTADGATDPVSFAAGVLQGDSSSCILYNISFQPLHDLLRALGWQTLLNALHLYERTSNARINASKSAFWLVGHPSPTDSPHAAALASLISAHGLSCLSNDPVITHLGHPISRTPSPPLPAILERLAAIRCRALCFPTLGVCILSRVQKAKQFLTSRLWHCISLGALPTNFSVLYYSTINPYLFAPTNPYISPADLARPRHLGGFGLIHPDHMATALSLSFLRQYLPDTGSAGGWLRSALTDELRRGSEAPPALLLARSSPAFTSLQHGDKRAEGGFGRLLHALAIVDLGLSDDWVLLPAPALLTLPWTLVFRGLHLSDQNLVRYTRTGWITLGDLLWLAPTDAHGPLHPGARLGIPRPAAVRANCRSRPYRDGPPGSVPTLGVVDLWGMLPSPVAATLSAFAASSASAFGLQPPFAAVAPPAWPSAQSWLPFRQDPGYDAFPWHLLTINGCPLHAAPPARVRQLLATTQPRSPGWTFPITVPPAFWVKVWRELEDSPLPADIRSTCLIVLGRNLWTFRATPLCPVGCPAPDSPTHGICACPEALRVWRACLPLLYALGVDEPLEFTAFHIVGAWPALPLLRPRIVLWRNVVLATLHHARITAGRDGRTAGRTPDFHHCDRHDVLSLATASVVLSLSTAWTRLLRRSAPLLRERFLKTWVTGSRLLTIIGDDLVPSPVFDGPPSLPMVSNGFPA